MRSCRGRESRIRQGGGIRLTKLAFLKQVRVKRDQPHWLTDEEGRRIGLKITTAGSAAIGVGDDGKGEEQPAPEPKRRAKKAAGRNRSLRRGWPSATDWIGRIGPSHSETLTA